jgi:hypothetical protein
METRMYSDTIAGIFVSIDCPAGDSYKAVNAIYVVTAATHLNPEP